ncbi:MAG: tetratricopeptide repeat protein [Acidobacteria bacterium]|nr:tetratricopeptide repeat protein [Acidobacteriota bacterium]
MAELRARLETVAGEVQVLRTRAEESEQRLAALTNELRATRESLDTIARAPAARPAPPSPGVPAPGMDPGSLAAGVIPAAASPAPQPPPPAAPGAPSAGTDLYRQAYSDYARGNLDQALSSLEEFLRLHAADDRADDARYLIGEVYFSQQKYPEAVGAYDRLLKDHADGERAASAHLKKGLALLEMNRTADAVIQFQHVVTAYPKSEEARAARERLRALGLRER